MEHRQRGHANGDGTPAAGIASGIQASRISQAFGACSRDGTPAAGIASVVPTPEAIDADLERWMVDTTVTVAPRAGMRIVVDLAPEDADLLRRAARQLDVDYTEFVKRAVLDAARGSDGERASDLVTVAAAAERFGVTRDRLQRAAMEGRLPARKVGEGRSHPWLLRPADVERFLRETRRGPRPRRDVA